MYGHWPLSAAWVGPMAFDRRLNTTRPSVVTDQVFAATRQYFGEADRVAPPPLPPKGIRQSPPASRTWAAPPPASGRTTESAAAAAAA
nr:hypothetical protein GCM10025699_74110 [Microbacterium flavescens]